jgi:hypothetical protein
MPKKTKASTTVAATTAPTRAPNSFIVTEICEFGTSELSLFSWVIVRSSANQQIVFWGNSDNNANIKLIQQQKPPFTVTSPTYATSKIGVHWAVAVDSPVRIDKV